MLQGVPTHNPARPSHGAQRVRGTRADIQGLRALAVALVVLFHFWPKQVAGGYVGVDVFFVISGYLITAHLIRRPPRTARDLATFWARRIRRLLPAAVLVLVVTLAATRVLAPALEWERTAHGVIASAWYIENWSLAAQSVDYLNADTAPTAVQHYWSLSVEEQFYLVWPLLILGAILVARKTSRSQRDLLKAVFGTVFAATLAYSIYTTATEPQRAFFITPNRAWEFAAGAAVAWVAQYSRARLTSRASIPLAWMGIAVIMVAGFRYSAATPFPGYAALLPVLGTAAVLVAVAEGRGSPDALWRVPIVQWLGDRSYSIYLWHWPLIIIAAGAIGHEPALLAKVALLAATIGLAALTKRHVEDRFRTPPAGTGLRHTYRLAAAGMAVVTLLSLVQLGEVSRRASASRAAIAVSSRDFPCFGAAAMTRGPIACPPDPSAPFVPDLALASTDRSDAYADRCFTYRPYSARKTCTFGTGPTQVALVGNSHAGHWLPALQVLADRMGWTITTYLVSVCNVSDALTSMATPSHTGNCANYASWAFDKTRGNAYDLVLTSEQQAATVAGHTWATTATASKTGYTRYLSRWADSGAKIVVLKDVVPPGELVGRLPECLARHPNDRQRCAWPQAAPTPTDPAAYRWMDPLYDAALTLNRPEVRTVIVDDHLCAKGICQPVIGTVVTYVDGSHLTATYARTLAPVLQQRISHAAGL